MTMSQASVAELMDVTAQCRTRDEYEAARLEWLQRAIGVDSTYVGPATPDRAADKPTATGVSAPHFTRCETEADRYWDDRLALTAAALRSGGVMADHDVFSLERRERMPFYCEIVRGHGIHATSVSVLRAQGELLGCLYLGRTSRGARFGAELERLRQALPALSLGKRLFDVSPGPCLPQASDAAMGFTRREQDVLGYLVRGLTNAEIAALLGTSPFTVKNQVAGMLAKAHVKNRTELVYLATRARVDVPKPGSAAK